MVFPRSPGPDSQSHWAGLSTPAPRARTLSPPGPAGRAPRPGASAVGVRGASSHRTTRPASVGSSGTATCQPPQAFPHDRPWPSFGRSVSLRGRPRVLVYQRGRPHRLSSPAGATSGPEAWHRHTGATGSIPQAPPACWKSCSCDVAKSRPSWLPKGRTIYKRPPGGAGQPSPASAGRSRIYRRPGRHTARPERRSRPGTPRPPRSSRPPRRDRGSRRGTGKEDLGLSGRGGRVTGTRQNFPGVAGGRAAGRAGASGPERASTPTTVSTPIPSKPPPPPTERNPRGVGKGRQAPRRTHGTRAPV